VHKNEIFKAIQAVGLDPNEFDLEELDDEVGIRHKWSKSYFIVSRESGYYVGRSLVGDGIVWPISPGSWQTLMPSVSFWLQQVKHDLDTPDLWAELKHNVALIEGGAYKVIENAPFTPDEQKEIALRLDKLAKDLRHTLSLSGAQIQVLKEKMEDVAEASSRLGRKDWLNYFIGVTLPFVLTATLAPEAARALFVTFLRAIGLLYPELPLLD
jgi:hypothetical protein